MNAKTRVWIPAAETKPPIGEPVIVTTWDRTVVMAQWYGDRWQTPYRYSEDVVAWMEIEPYGETKDYGVTTLSFCPECGQALKW